MRENRAYGPYHGPEVSGGRDTLLKPPKETELHRDDLPRTLTEERSPEVPASPEGQSTRLMGLGWLEGSVWGLCLAVQLLPSEQETCNSVLNWQHKTLEGGVNPLQA